MMTMLVLYKIIYKGSRYGYPELVYASGIDWLIQVALVLAFSLWK